MRSMLQESREAPMPQGREAAPYRPERFLALALRNRANAAILERLPALHLPDAWLVAGCLFQTVWNCLTGRPPEQDILDYDIFYYDNADLSWEAEDQAIRRAAPLFQDLPVRIELRNQARVHLWYEQRFGIACPPLRSACDGIDHFPNQSSCFGVRRLGRATQIHAPFGYSDLFSLTLRPNPRRDVPHVYNEKAARWRRAWPVLKVVPWPGG